MSFDSSCSGRPSVFADTRTSRTRSRRRIDDGPVPGIHRRNLAERLQNLVAVVVVLVRRHRELRQILGVPPLIGAQPDAHVVVVADRILNRRRHDADHARLHRRCDHRDGNAEIARALAVDVDAQLGFRFLEAVLDVGRAGICRIAVTSSRDSRSSSSISVPRTLI